MGDAEASSPLRITLLGGMRIEAAPGVELDPGPRKCQELLAALALEPQVAITVGRLVELLWGEDPPRTAEKTLQTYVARLRKALGADAIVRAGTAYRLDIDPASIDTFRFRSALRRGDNEAALQEWTGAPLAGIEVDGLQPLLDGLVEEWLGAVEVDLALAVESDPGGAMGRLTEMVAAHPFREGMWALLMTALYRSGRQAEALDAYRRARAALVEELGVEPSPRLRDLERQILNQDEQLTAGFERRADPGADPRHGGGAPPVGVVTFGFAELDRVSALWADQPADAADVIAEFERIVGTVAGDHGGTLFARGAETLGVAFHSATEAGNWAAELHGALADRQWPHGSPVATRVALHTGEADERNGSYYGPTVTLATRLVALGHPGQTIATTVTALLSGETDQHLGWVSLEGVPDELSLNQIGPGSFPPLQITTQSLDRLPRPANRLIGRHDLLGSIAVALADAPVVTLVGPGGIGKTRLAIEAARRDGTAGRDGAWFVELADIADSAEVERAVADALGVHETAQRSVLDTIVAALRSRTSLVVLDNCEHLIEGTGRLVTELIQRCPDVTVLTTSREGLGVPAEQLVVVGPLDAAEAGVELFIERALAADGSFDADGQRATIGDVCRRLDGVPLAIELAAARVRSLAPADLLARLDDSFRLLTGVRRGAVERHQTLRATIQWSYDLLSPQQQLVFRRLSVFAGSFDLAAAEQVIPDEDLSVIDVGVGIGDLVDRSMCIVESGTSGRRFRLLEPMRQFAAEELRSQQERSDLRRRHTDHVRSRIADIRALLAGPQETRGAVELDELWPNLRVAVDEAHDRQDLDLAVALVGPIVSQGFMRRGLGELRDWIERTMEVADVDNDATIIADGLFWTALYAQLTDDRTDVDRLMDRFGTPDLVYARLAKLIVEGDTAGIIAISDEAVAEAHRRNDVLLMQLCTVLTVGNLVTSGQIVEAEARANALIDSRQGADQPMPPTFLNWLLYLVATARALQGDAVAAEAIYDRIAAMRLPPRASSPTEVMAARRASKNGDHRTAHLILRNHIGDLLEVDDVNGTTVVALEFLHIMARAGQLDEAAVILGYFESSRLLDPGGQWFRALLEEPNRLVSDNPAAAMVRDRTVDVGITAPEALAYMTDTLDRLLDG
ncbi:MAG: BTAD domain-containing putative transcriptional regulator [Actinomycetota bacterium]